MHARAEWDVVVVGAGIAGLFAATSLQLRGRRVLLAERLPYPGGLCGNWTEAGYTFSRACNDFAAGARRELKALGVTVGFVPMRTAIFSAAGRFDLPPGIGTAAALVPAVPAMLRLVWAVRDARHHTLRDALEAAAVPPRLRALIGSFCGLAAVPAHRIRLADVRAMAADPYRYGLHDHARPIGGPGAVTDALVQRFEAAGGTLQLGCAVTGVRRDGGAYTLDTAAGPLHARRVVTSRPRWDQFPAESVPGIRIAKLHLGLEPGYTLPGGANALVHVPADPIAALEALDAGALPDDLGFHLYQSAPVDGRPPAIGCYVPWARGLDDPDPAVADAAVAGILARLDTLAPGLGGAIRFQRFLSPAAFERLHGQVPSPVPVLPPVGFRKPDAYDPATGLHHVGNSVWPPGENLSTAVRSGVVAAEHVFAELEAECV